MKGDNILSREDINNSIRSQAEIEAEEILCKLKLEWGESKKSADEKLEETIQGAEEAAAKLESIEETDYEKLVEEKFDKAAEEEKSVQEEIKEAAESESGPEEADHAADENGTGDKKTEEEIPVTVSKRRVGPWIIAPIVGGAIIAIAVPVNVYNSHGLNITKYISAQYDGINGYAKAKFTFDKEAFYKDLSNGETKSDKLVSYRKLADSVAVTSSDTTISNGENISLNINYDKDAMKSTGYHIKKDSYTYKASGIAEGKSVNLFKDISVKINGISPEATAIVLNNSTDEYLKTLQYKTDKSTGLANGDQIMITCEVSAEELAAHGYVTNGTSVMYKVSGLSTYVSDAKKVTKEVVTNIAKADRSMLDSETVDTTFRMVYKLTGNRDFLGLINNESLSEFNVSKAFFLKKKDSDKNTNDPENILVLIHKIKITADDRTEEGYAAVMHYNCFIKDGGNTVEADTSNLKKQYGLGLKEEELIQLNVKNKAGSYEITEIDLK